jgi:hypothetical protein
MIAEEYISSQYFVYPHPRALTSAGGEALCREFLVQGLIRVKGEWKNADDARASTIRGCAEQEVATPRASSTSSEQVLGSR